MAKLFSSFDEAWSYFRGRSEPLAGFFDDFPDDVGSQLEGWVIEPSAEVKSAAADVQAALAHVDGLVFVPTHFLHVWLGLRERIGDAWRGWSAVGAIDLAYANVNCFHAAVVVEAAGEIRRLVEGTPNDVPTFLPHLTVAVTREPIPPDALREALRPLRQAVLGVETVREAKLVRFPPARSTLFQPWAVEQVTPLR